jgi:hypothetical protein
MCQLHIPQLYFTKVTNLFKHTNLKIAFRSSNTIHQQLSPKLNNAKSIGIYQLKCNTCKNIYIGQVGKSITTRHKEHLRYIKNNNPTDAYVMHILNNRNEFGPAEQNLKLLKPCTKRTRMDCWKALFVHMHQKHNILIPEQRVIDSNPLFDLAYTPTDLQNILPLTQHLPVL